MSDKRPICKSCGQYLPLPKPRLGRLDPETELRGALGRRDPVSRSKETRATGGQLIIIGSLASARGIDAGRACLHLFGASPELLTKTAASLFINFLRRVSPERFPVARKGSDLCQQQQSR